MENEQADAGQDCRSRLARPNSQARTRTGNINFPCSADHVQDWQPNPVDPYSCYMWSPHIHPTGVGPPKRYQGIDRFYLLRKPLMGRTKVVYVFYTSCWSPERLALPPLSASFLSSKYPRSALLNQHSLSVSLCLVYMFFSQHPSLPRFPQGAHK